MRMMSAHSTCRRHDSIGVPAFGQHRHRHYAADLFAQATRTANGVHHFAQQRALTGFARPSDSSLARRQLALELLDLGTGGVSKALVQGVAGFDLTGVDQQRARAREAAALVVRVPEELQVADMEGRALTSAASPRSKPAIQSKTSLEMAVFWHTTMKTGGTPIPARSQRPNPPA
jgi:hypothetical protein